MGLEDGYRPEKTLWDWLGLLIVPAVLALGAIYFNRAERHNESQIAEQRAQDVLLQTYLDQMTELLFAGKLRDSQPGDEVRHVAQARTLIALRRLDRERRVILIQFLRASQLIGVREGQVVLDAYGKIFDNDTRMIVDFRDVDLSGVDLSFAPLYSINFAQANLQGVDLRMADLTRTHLTEADLRWGNLRGAFLTKADLKNANLAYASLQTANLREADLSGVDLGGADLLQVSLLSANMRGAFLAGANLQQADLRGADLRETNLIGADLSNVDLTGADLTGADLTGANVTQAQLAGATSRNGLTMPDGSKQT